jgi:hypothetical protein
MCVIGTWKISRRPGVSLGDEIMARFVSSGALRGVVAAASLLAGCIAAAPVRAQNAAIDDIKGKIFDAKMAQQTFAGGLRHCNELNGVNFYFQPRDRVLNLEEYHRSLDNLALQGVFNPQTHRPWNQQDADTRWAQVQQEALKDQANCALVASLPDLQKKLQALQLQAAASQNAPTKK